MFIELRREKGNKETHAIPGKLYINGSFFAYTLENDLYNIPTGFLKLYDRLSPKFAKHKVHIEVPGRNFIMFHGGNYPDHSRGCVVIAKNRINDSYIQGDQSDVLYSLVKSAWDAGEKITFVVYRPLILLAAAAGAFGLYYIAKK
jgi:hypothetical protein